MSEHNHDCDCENNDEEIITLTTEDGDLDCEVIAAFPVGENQYIALAPVDAEEDDELFFFRLQPVDGDDDECELIDLDDDAEFEAVADAFDELIDEADWEDLTDDEE